MIKNFNIDLLWERLYEYWDYKNLTRKEKQIADRIYLSFYKVILHSFESSIYKGKENHVDIYDYESTETSKFRADLGNWLIDNNLGLVFSNLFGSHVVVRAELMNIHAFKNGDISDENTLFREDNLKLADLYTGLQYGIYLSGMNDTPIEKCDIVIGSRYFILNKEFNQNRLTYDFELNVSPYERHEARKDYKELIERLNKEKESN